jgi:hypothetical protein
MLLGLGECSACLIQVGAFFLMLASGPALAPAKSFGCGTLPPGAA